MHRGDAKPICELSDDSGNGAARRLAQFAHTEGVLARALADDEIDYLDFDGAGGAKPRASSSVDPESSTVSPSLA